MYEFTQLDGQSPYTQYLKLLQLAQEPRHQQAVEV